MKHTLMSIDSVYLGLTKPKEISLVQRDCPAVKYVVFKLFQRRLEFQSSIKQPSVAVASYLSFDEKKLRKLRKQSFFIFTNPDHVYLVPNPATGNR